MKSLLIAACLLLPCGITCAQDPVPATTTGDVAVLEPFVASYEVFRGGKSLGEATMQVVSLPARRWRVDLMMRGTRSLFAMAGVNAEQSTVFDANGETYRPLTQATLNRTVFTQKKTIGVYDWRAGSATWQGDVKESRKGPLALQNGDMSGLLINLAVIRDAEPGKTLPYRFVDNGRVRNHRYVVADEPESVLVAGIGYSAMRVDRIEDGNEETVIWVVKDVPTPIRMLQREDGVDTYDLRLIEYKGV